MLNPNRQQLKKDLRWNKVTAYGAKALLDLLHRNRTLTEIDLAGNDVPRELIEAIQAHLGRLSPTSVPAETSNGLAATLRCLRSANEETLADLTAQLEKVDEERRTLGQRLFATESELYNLRRDAMGWDERAKNAEMERDTCERAIHSLQEETGMLLKKLEEQLEAEKQVCF